MLNKILDLLNNSNVSLSTPVQVESVEKTGIPDNQVVKLRWTDTAQQQCGSYLTKEGLETAVYDDSTGILTVNDHEGDELKLQLVPKANDNVVFVFVQEGGSTGEAFVHVYNTHEDAVAGRKDCATDGSYRTSDIFEAASNLVDYPGFHEIAEALAGAFASFDYLDDEE